MKVKSDIENATAEAENIPTNTKKQIVVPPIRKGTLLLTVLGDSPLIVHAWGQKSIKQMLSKQLKEAKSAREAKDPTSDFEESLYRLEGGGYGFPSVAFKTSAVTACTSVEGVTKIAARQAFHIIGEPIQIKTIFDGRLMRKNLVRIHGSEPEMREDPVKIGMGVADLRYRGQFWPWYAELKVSFNQNVLSESQIINIINVSGFGVGVGEWRPERDREYGMFHVAAQSEVTNFLTQEAAE